MYRCLNYINKPLIEIKSRDLRDFLKSIDQSDLAYSTKIHVRSTLNAFFDYVEYRFLELDIDFRNPVPNKNVFTFSKSEEDLQEKEEILYTDEDLLEILKLTKSKSLRDFILFGVLASTGMRISECITIKIENINLKERLIKTGTVREARKSKKVLKFFVPERFTKYLELYIHYLNKESGFLFPGKNKINHLHPNAFYIYVKKNYGHKYATFHKFRKSIITRRIKSECPLLISEMLMNHKSRSVEGNHYVKLTLSEKKELYDKWDPYKFIPYF